MDLEEMIFYYLVKTRLFGWDDVLSAKEYVNLTNVYFGIHRDFLLANSIEWKNATLRLEKFKKENKHLVELWRSYE